LLQLAGNELLQPIATPTEQEINDDNQQNQAETASAVIADTWTHVISAAAKYEQENDEKNYEWHARQCSTVVKICGDTESLDGRFLINSLPSNTAAPLTLLTSWDASMQHR
jgi:hypothetical protein